MHYNSLLSASRSGGDSATWVAPTLAAISTRLEFVAERRKRMDALSQDSSLVTEERERRSGQLQTALDELTTGASRAEGMLRAQTEQHQQHAQELSGGLCALFDSLPPEGEAMQDSTLEAPVRALRVHHRACAASEAKLAELSGAREDLLFQITQIKGRIGMLQREDQDQRQDTGRVLAEIEAEIEEELAALEPDLERLVAFEQTARLPEGDP